MMKTFAADKVELIYVAEDGEEFLQPVSDLVYAGSLIDPDTGDDMEVQDVLLHDGDEELFAQPAEVQLVYVDEQGEKHTQPASDIVYVGTLIDPDTGDDMAINHVLFNVS